MTGERRNDGMSMTECLPDIGRTYGTTSIGKHICCSCAAVALLWCTRGSGADKERVPSTATAKLESSLSTVFATQTLRLRHNDTEVRWAGSRWLQFRKQSMCLIFAGPAVFSLIPTPTPLLRPVDPPPPIISGQPHNIVFVFVQPIS